MKRFILIAGIGFYTLTFVTIFAITYFMFSVSRPKFAEVLNVNTKDKVWQEDMAGLDLYWATRMAAITDPSHNAEAAALAAGAAEGVKTDYDTQVAYGSWYARLFADGESAAQPQQVSEGDEAYTEAVCWHCHSQFVRPLSYEQYRWGPVSQIAESAHENPTRFGTRRIGPDLTREGNARSDDWHYAHFNNPRYTVPQSIMARYAGITRYWNQVSQARRDELQSEAYGVAAGVVSDEAIETYKGNPSELAIASFGAASDLMDRFAEQGDEVWVLAKGTIGDSALLSRVSSEPIFRVVPKPMARIRNLTAYVQTRGLTIGKTAETNKWVGSPADVEALDVNNKEWQAYIRKLEFVSGRWRTASAVARPASRPEHVLAPAELRELAPADKISDDAEWGPWRGMKEKWDLSLTRGKNLFMAKCAGCHGGLELETGLPMEVDISDRKSAAFKMLGNGYGPAAQWLMPEPRNLHLGAYGRFALEKNEAGELVETKRELMPRERGTEVEQYKNRSGDPSVALARPEDLYQTLRNGMYPSAMPSWPFLKDWEIWDLVNFIMYLGDGEAGVQKAIFEEYPEADARAEALSYWNPVMVNKAFSVQVTAPDLARKPGDASLYERLSQDKDALLAATPSEYEDFAAGYWKAKLGDAISLAKDEEWTREELVAIGASLYAQTNVPARGGAAPDCKSCHGEAGDSWSGRRGELLFAHGFAARNYYSGQFKFGASREGIYRAMSYGVANTLMTSQVKVPTLDDPGGTFTALEAIALAEFVLDKARQGVYGIEDQE